MARIFKPGRVVIMTTGRFAGKKAVVARNSEEGNKKHRFPHLTLVGIARNPQKVQRKINKKRFTKKTGVKVFAKTVNQNHVMPTRFVVTDFDLKDVKDDNLKGEAKIELRKKLRKSFTDAYRTMPNPKTNEKAGNIRFLFQRLRF